MTGKVTIDNERPAVGARIEAVRWDRRGEQFTSFTAGIATVDTTGSYELKLIVVPPVTLKIEHPETADFFEMPALMQDQQDSPPPAPGAVIPRDFLLKTRAKIAGRVITESGEPVTSATVLAYEVTTQPRKRTHLTDEAVTDRDGLFQFSKTAHGEHRVVLRSAGLPVVTTSVTAPVNDVIIRVPKAFAVEGHVFDAETSRPITSASLMLREDNKTTSGFSYPYSERTDSNGKFLFAAVEPGKYILSGHKMGVPLRQGQMTLDMTDGKDTSGVVLLLSAPELQKPGSIFGHVTDALSGKPLAGVMVSRADSGDPPYKSEADGRYWLTVPYRGGHAGVSASKQGFVMKDAQSQMGDRQVSYVNLDPNSTVTLHEIKMTPLIPVSGKVLSGEGVPVAGAKLETEQLRGSPWPKPATTTHDGSYELLLPPMTDFRVKASREGYATTTTKELRTGDKPVTGINLVLDPEAVIAGRVFDPKGQPAADAQVEAWTALTNEDLTAVFDGRRLRLASQKTNTAGEFRLAGCPGGIINIEAGKEGFLNAKSQRLTVTPGSIKLDVELRLQQTHFLAGTIRNSAGKALKGIKVSAFDPNFGNSGPSTTGEDGKYRLTELSPGPVTVYLEHGGTLAERHHEIQVDREDADFVYDDAKQRTGTIIGKVIDRTTKQPLRTFTVNGKSVILGSEPGTFALEVKHLMSTEVIIAAPNYAPTKVRVEISEANPVVEQTFEIGVGGSVKGRVVDSGEKPIARVEISAMGIIRAGDMRYHHPLATTVSNERGEFSFDSLDMGPNTILFKPAMPLRERTAIAEVKERETTDLGDILVGTGCVVTGRIVQFPDMSPIVGKSVSVARTTYDPPWQTAISGPNGEFRFEGLREGAMHVWAPELKLERRLNLKPNETVEVDLMMGGGIIKGRLLYGSQPFAAELKIFKGTVFEGEQLVATVQTDSDGRFTATLRTGSYQMKAVPPGFTAEQQADSTLVQENEVIERDFVIPSGQVSGVVVDQDGKPTAKAEVWLMQGGGAVAIAFTAEDGSFLMQGVRDGVYGTTARAPKGSDGIGPDVTIAGGQAAPPVTIRIENKPTGHIQFTVQGDSARHSASPKLTRDGARVNARISMNPRNRQWSIRDVPEGNYRLEVSGYCSGRDAKDVTVTGGQTTVLELALVQSAQLSVYVRAPDGSVVPQAIGSLHPETAPAGRPLEAISNESGTVTFEAVSLGRYKLNVTAPDGKTATQEVDLSSCENASQTLTVTVK